MESEYLKNRRERECFGIKGPQVKTVKVPFEEKKKGKPIQKKSQKMKGELKKYLPEVKKFLEEHKYCEIKMEGCQGKAVCVHHSRGRIGHKLHDQADWVASCAKCNLAVETNDLEAREKGFKKSVHKV